MLQSGCGDSKGKLERAWLLQVQELLLRHAPALAASSDKQAFLRERMGVPPDWLAGALVVWARYSRDAAGHSHLQAFLCTGSTHVNLN